MTTETTMVTARSHGFLLAALVLVVAAGMGMKWQDVQCGDVLDVDHGQYRLTGDLVCPAGPPHVPGLFWQPALTITGIALS